MSIFDNVAKGLDVLAQETKRVYDAKKLELRIKNYRKEETGLYTRLGKLLYQQRGMIDEIEFDAICNNIDTIHARMKQLDRQITDIRSRADDDDTAHYLRLDRKESDLTIKRTAEGIKLIRLCPACKVANSPNSDVCEQCQRPFSE